MPEKRPRESTNSLATPPSPPKRSRTTSQTSSHQPTPVDSWTSFSWLYDLAGTMMNVIKKQDVKTRTQMREDNSTKRKSGRSPNGTLRLRDTEASPGHLLTLIDEKDAETLARSSSTSSPSSPDARSPHGSDHASPSRSQLDFRLGKRPSSIDRTDLLFDEGRLSQSRRGSVDSAQSEQKGTSSQPIELSDSDTEDPPQAGPSRIQATPAPLDLLSSHRRADPKRPNLSKHKFRREYEWLDDAPNIDPSTPRRGTDSPLRSPSSLRRKTKRETQRVVRQQKVMDQIKVLRRQLKVAAMDGDHKLVRGLTLRLDDLQRSDMASPARRTEGFYKRFVSIAGIAHDNIQNLDKQAKNALEVLLESRADRSISALIRKTDSADSDSKIFRRASRTKEDIQSYRESKVQDIIDKVEKTHIKEEQEIQKRLRPACPIKMSPARAGMVSNHLRNSAFKARQVMWDDVQRLRPVEWLNDEVINTYGELMTERYQTAAKDGSPGQYRNIYVFNSFFYQKLREQGYEKAGLSRWTKRGKGKADIFSKDAVLFPCNIGNMHWTAGCINIAQKRFEYYDSLGDRLRHRDEVYDNMREYIEKEHKDKKGSSIDLSDWTEVFLKSSPQQSNGSDCGVFTCQTLEAIARGKDLSRGEEWDFGAENMPYLRNLMVYEIAQEKLEPRWPKET